MMGPRRHWGRPPPVSERWARAAYFGEWNPRILPRRGAARGEGRRAYEVRLWMTGLVFTIHDHLEFVDSVDVPQLLERLKDQQQAGAHQSDRFENEDLYWGWLWRALTELHHRTADLPPGTPIPGDDWHLRDLERLRRVAAKMADYLFLPLPKEQRE